ncbi:MAG TPA: hypothetical protein VJI15_06370 [Candidatus Nanoarchaeia archaeon]|nr:hypothetical protein [Candidatus Nanoarchaeia archaeon]
MTLEALALLEKLADASQRDREIISKEEIKKKINEIKYLSTQKKVPKLTLRKEIIHLENEFKKMDVLEQKIGRLQKSHHAKVASLKKENAALRQRLAATGDGDISNKVNKLSHLIGESLAKKEVHDDVLLSEKIAQDIKDAPEAAQRATMMKQRLDMLKQELENSKAKEAENPEKIGIIEQMIANVEQSLAQFAPSEQEEPPGWYSQESLEKQPLEPEIKHDLIFHPPPPKKRFVNTGVLPLPPPPSELP